MPHTRRAFLTSGLTALSLEGVLRLRAASARASSAGTAVIFVQLGGGASHFETYDPKPDAPAEYRGAFRAIPTAVPGVAFCELMPRQARLARDLAVVRSVTHHEASHIALHMVETGYFLRNPGNGLRGEMPAVGCAVSRVRGGRAAGLPPYVSLPRAQAYSGPHHLGEAHAAFDVREDPSGDGFRVAGLSPSARFGRPPLEDREALRREFDRAAAHLDGEPTAGAMSAYRRQALELLTGPKAREAFDLTREPAKMRERYGRNAFGQRLLLARRLAEAGVPFVVVRTFDWDDHKDLPGGMKARSPQYDAGMAALIEDLQARGLGRDVLVVAMGEFGRTPRVNKDAGRDHWPPVMSVLLAGGRYRMGQVIGASDAKGAAVKSAPYRPQNVLGMVYRHLGIDPGLTFPDRTGRPRHLLEEREPITELVG